jgi:membrane protein
MLENLEAHEEVLTWIIEFAHNLLEHTKGGLMAAIGLLLLFWSILKLLGHVERAFDDIWGIRQSRPFGRKITDYLSIIFIAPVLIVISSTATVLISGQIKVIVKKISLLEAMGPAIYSMLKILPYGTLWILFAFAYIFMPNTGVRFVSAAVGGIIAGTIYHLFQWAYIAFQIGVAKSNAIYGTFAALPLFLVWLQFSWLIVLFGAEISFAHQNLEIYEYEPGFQKASPEFMRLLALSITHRLVKDFSKAAGPRQDFEIARETQIPLRMVREILHQLVQSGIVSRIRLDDEQAEAYQPGCNPDILTISYVIKALEKRGQNTLPVAQSPEMSRIAAALQSFDEMIQNSPANVRLRDI